MTNKLSQLKSMTAVVADTGDILAIQKYQPLDATTNPSLLLKAAELPHYQALLQSAIVCAGQQAHLSSDEQLALGCELFATAVGAEILTMIPGRVSTEVDARYSFDREKTLAKARQIIELYQQRDIGAERVLIKIAATWEGIRAAEQLEKEGIHCNLTLLFGFSQAVACAEAGVFLISPFVGRILDWHKHRTGREHWPAHEDPGVVSVTRIYNYYKQHGYQTVVMGASFRNASEIEALAGCDRLTISPALLEELANDHGDLERRLGAGEIHAEAKTAIDEVKFRWQLNDDAMATEKLAEGIRNFAADQLRLEQLLKSAAAC
jgi:transaldolase